MADFFAEGFKVFQDATRNKNRAKDSLPPPPTGQAWQQDLRTKEWKLVRATKTKDNNKTRSEASSQNNKNSSSSNNPSHSTTTITRDSSTTPSSNETKTTTQSSNNNMLKVKSASSSSKNHPAHSPRITPTKTTTPQSSPMMMKKVVLDQLPDIQESRPQQIVSPLSANNNSSTANSGGGVNLIDSDWDLLSDRFSQASGKSQQGTILISTKGAGSVRSIADILIEDDHHYPTEQHAQDFTMESDNNNDDCSRRTPKIQRTHSNSTIDSYEYDHGDVGPHGKGTLGVDYVEHVILPTDTLQGLCLAYKISATKLRQANHFSGNSLLLAPKKLVIPISKKARAMGYWRVQDTDAKEYKLYNFLAEFTNFQAAEARAYLELADWNLKDAKQSAQEDLEWEREFAADGESHLKAGEIRITQKKGLHLTMQGAGIGGLGRTKNTSNAKKNSSNKMDTSQEGPRPVVYAPIPAIATKSVQPKDVYQASPQHDNYGVELKDIIHPVSP